MPNWVGMSARPVTVRQDYGLGKQCLGNTKVIPAGKRQSKIDPTFRRASSNGGPPVVVEPTVQEERVTNMKEEGTPRPHQDSYFLPGKIRGRNVQCLLDSGCTTNILSKHVFDRLPSALTDRLEARRTHAALADGTQISFYVLVSLELKLKRSHP